MIEARLFLTTGTYMPEPSRPCSPEIVCLVMCQCQILMASRKAKQSEQRVGHTKKQHQFGCPVQGVSKEILRLLHDIHIGRFGDGPIARRTVSF